MSQRCHTGLVRRNNGAAMSCISPVAVCRETSSLGGAIGYHRKSRSKSVRVEAR